MTRPLYTALLLLLGVGLLVVRPAFAASPAEQLGALAGQVDTALARLDAGDLASARAAYQSFDAGWVQIEDGIKAQSRPSYKAIEGAMGEVKTALRTEPVDAARLRAALQHLRAECDVFIASAGAPQPAAEPAPATSTVTLPTVIGELQMAQRDIAAGDVAGASARVADFQRDWLEVEGLVKTTSAPVYTSTENNMAQAAALLAQRPPDTAGAGAVLAQMERDLAPLATGELRYGVFDAAVILLREGLEALLVIAALLAFLTKTGYVEQRRWIWAGGGAGILASVAIALVANVVFARAAAGTNRELLEGITGLFAAGMLIYVSFWLHSKAKLGAWQEYIRAKSTAALARNSLLSLALIAFLAVFREGAETVLFYVGIASSIALGDLLLGLAIGAAGLAAIGVLMLAFGVRVPIRPFFLGTSLLLYYLAFKFVGTGLHALQVAGLLPATAKPFLPNWDLVGLYPTVETTLVQVAILVLGCAVLALAGRRPAARPAAAQPA